MITLYRAFRDFFTSLKLTVWLLALGIVLIFWATLSQADLGVWGVQQKFFHSFFVLGHIPGTEIPVPLFPGGYFIGGLLLINLISAHALRFKLTWRKSGIWLTHIGLILLLVGQFLTGIIQRESQLVIDEGQTKNYTESSRDNELVIVDTTDPKVDDVVAIPEEMLAKGDVIQNPKLPFRVVPKLYMANAELQMRSQVPDAPPSLANQGIFGPQVVATPIPETTREDERNLPAAYVELVGPDGSLGTWLVSSGLPMPQHFEYGGRSWKIALRFQRHYLPFEVTLLKFTHDIYPGTNIDKNFASRVRLTPPDGGPGREVRIYMNNPLRTDGLTFYQQSFGNEDRTSVLEVVHNPADRLPYIACSMMALGLILQFGLHLAAFAKRRRVAQPAPA